MFEKINLILSQWDPIGVGYPLSLNEYKQYIPKIISLINDRIRLKEYLEEMLDSIGLSYDENNRNHKKDIQIIVDKILLVKEK